MSRPRSHAALFTLLVAVACSADPEPSDPNANTHPAGAMSAAAGNGAITPPGDTGAGDTPPGNTPPGNTAQPSTGCSSEVIVSETHNYSFSSQLEISVVSVKPDTNLTFDWSGLSRDFMGHDVDPLADVDFVLAVLWKLTAEQLTEQMNDDLLNQGDIVAPAMFYTENQLTSVELFQAQLFEMPLTPEELLPSFSADQYDPANYTYSLMVRTGTSLIGTGTRMIQLFKLDPESEQTTVNLTNDSTKLSYEVDLKSAQPTRIPAGTAAISVDWGEDTAGLATNALGNAFQASRVSEVRVAYYEESIEELEQQFLDLPQLVDREWRRTFTSGSSVRLDDLTVEAAQPFPVIDESGTWILGLVCGECSNPAPWYLTRLRPCPL